MPGQEQKSREEESGMKKLVVGLGIVVILVVLAGAWLRGTYNELVRSDEAVNGSWAQVENVLQRRLDLIPNLVETVRGYASHERETLQAVTDARAKFAGAGTIPEKIDANQQLSSVLGRLLLVVERYPDLKANQNFLRLQDELAGTENRIAVERRRYNEHVRDYNIKVRSFPTALFAGMLGFEKAKMLEADPGAGSAPQIDFSAKEPGRA
jgi:LemA protein